jgi:ketosteroid isomerase-like protein
MALRFPSVVAAQARVIARLPPSSRVRQAALARTIEHGLEAFNRRDLAAAVGGCRPDFEYRPVQHWVDSGLVESSYRGLDGYRTYVSTVDEVWAGQNYLDPLELIDVGDRLLALAQGHMRAQASGVPLMESFALLTTLEDGMGVCLQEYYDHDEALEAIGVAVDRTDDP